MAIQIPYFWRPASREQAQAARLDSAALTAGNALYHPGIGVAGVHFDGTTTPPTIKHQWNVAGVVKNVAGDYTITLDVTMADQHYGVFGTTVDDTGGTPLLITSSGVANTVTTTRIQCRGLTSHALVDSESVSVFVLGFLAA